MLHQELLLDRDFPRPEVPMFLASFGGTFAVLAAVLSAENRMARCGATLSAHEAHLKAILGLSFVSGIAIAGAGHVWTGLAIALAP
jgi:hypothetical protein